MQDPKPVVGAAVVTGVGGGVAGGATVVGVSSSGSTQVASHSAPSPPYIVSLRMLCIICIICPTCIMHHILYVYQKFLPYLASLIRPEEHIEGTACNRHVRGVVLAEPDTWQFP